MNILCEKSSFKPVYFSVKIEMWELPQIRILQMRSENVGTTTF
ncbi:hypothetical protein LEP1GSC021_2302 [Leptospira noguchii str. 1993005606]|nr:hypothetical protein LEP1GSC021_2302 [Leptospira noguchii str. 1993005606]